MVRYYILFSLLLLFDWGIGQLDTTVVIEDIVIISDDIRYNEIGTSYLHLSPNESRAKRSNNLATRLQQEGGLYIKNYGPNTLATTSLRGSSASQTLVLWNGLPIQSPMLGLLDLSIIQGGTNTEAIVYKGGSSTMWGSGAVGGVIALNTTHSFFTNDKVASIEFGFGSFGQRTLMGNISNNYGNLSVSAFAKLQNAQNNYPYALANGKQQSLSNARSAQEHWGLSTSYYMSKGKILTLNYWGFDADRQVPPTTTQSQSKAQQKDYGHRLMVEFSTFGKLFKVSSKLGFFDEINRYQDRAINLQNTNKFRTLLADIGIQHRVKRSTWLGGVTWTHYRGLSEGNYLDWQSESRVAIFAKHQYKRKKTTLYQSIRREWATSFIRPLIPEVGADINVGLQHYIKVKSGRVFRLPTMNDRYWIPGGNEMLQPELGWSHELGYQFIRSHKGHNVKIVSTLFTRMLNDWILWSPQPHSSLWSPQNITRVWSRGVEANASYENTFFQLLWIIKSGLTYNLATFQESVKSPSYIRGAQLPYTPEWQGNLYLESRWHGWALYFNNYGVGATKGVNDDIDPYLLTDIGINYQWIMRWGVLATTFDINNITDKSYRVIERRPMPGRNYHLGIVIKL